MKNKKKLIEVILISICMTACVVACGGKKDSVSNAKNSEKEELKITINNEHTEMLKEEQTEGESVLQPGPYGEIKMTIPEGWKYELCEIDSDKLNYGMNGVYGIQFYPEDAKKGCIELVYVKPFGVCGTGLEEETVELAGANAVIGTYDNKPYWDFIMFQGKNEGLVANTNNVADWIEENKEQVLQILDTVELDTSKKTGGAFIDKDASYNNDLGVHFYLKNITPTGATAVFLQYDSEITEEISFGEDFKIEVEKDGNWKEADIVVKGAYGFNDIAHLLSIGDMVEAKLDWEWLYGELEPGNYRITKTVNQEEITAYFVLN